MTPTPRPGLRGFDIHELAQFSFRKNMPDRALDHWVFYVGLDDVHGILQYGHSRFNQVGKGNMFGFDDPQLNQDIIDAGSYPGTIIQWSLDASQAGGAHEAQILKSDFIANPTNFKMWFKILRSETGQISHTKGGVLDNAFMYEGSTNWSKSGEGTYSTGMTVPGGPGYQAQNNTLTIFTDPDTIAAFSAELDAEHATGRPVVPTWEQTTLTPAS